MVKIITIHKDKNESIKDFQTRTELLSLTLENDHHFENNETDNIVYFTIY